MPLGIINKIYQFPDFYGQRYHWVRIFIFRNNTIHTIISWDLINENIFDTIGIILTKTFSGLQSFYHTNMHQYKAEERVVVDSKNINL